MSRKILLEDIIKKTEDADIKIRRKAVKSLCKIKDPNAIPFLTNLLDNDIDQIVRREVIKALSVIEDEDIIPILIKTLEKDKSIKVRSETARALGEMEGAKVVHVLLNTLENDVDANVRSSAAVALGKIKDPNAIKTLAKTMKNDCDEYVRRVAVDALVEINDVDAIFPLIRQIEDEIKITDRINAFYALGTIKEIRAVPALIKILENDENEKNYFIRAEAARALGNIGDSMAVPALILAADNNKADGLDSYYTDALLKIKDEKSILGLIHLLESKHDHIRLNATSALGKAKNEMAINPLISASVYDENNIVRETAVESLYVYANKKIVPKLLKLLLNEKDQFIRGRFICVLGNIGNTKDILELEKANETDEEALKKIILDDLEYFSKIS